MEKSRKQLTFITLIILTITAVIVFYTNRIIPFMMDDLWYSTLLDSDKPIASIADIIHAHPTCAEAFMEACADALGECKHLPKK